MLHVPTRVYHSSLIFSFVLLLVLSCSPWSSYFSFSLFSCFRPVLLIFYSFLSSRSSSFLSCFSSFFVLVLFIHTRFSELHVILFCLSPPRLFYPWFSVLFPLVPCSSPSCSSSFFSPYSAVTIV